VNDLISSYLILVDDGGIEKYDGISFPKLMDYLDQQHYLHLIINSGDKLLLLFAD
jgi:hypothetical protein